MITKRLSGARLRVLLVEDNPAHAALIMRGLEQLEIPNDVYHASDGEAALDYLLHREPYADVDQNPQPHVILLDIRMPKMNGLEVLRTLKANPDLKHIPVIILTTSSAEKDVARAYENYANSYLVKPGDFDDFMAMMNEFGLYWLNWNHTRES